MASSKYDLFVNFPLFFLLLQNIILISATSECLNPTFENNQKVVVDYYFNYEKVGIGSELCKIILNSNGLVSMVYRMSSDLKNKESCTEDELCLENRRLACNYKYDADAYNDCNKSLPGYYTELADCVCDGSADNILTSNETARVNYGIKTLPGLVLNQKYDPCFTDYSFEGMKAYFCKAYKNGLPVCK